ncbi:MAG: S8 family serine peptidase [Candidatus Nomurabacteria bacterium]|nr:S8 family serine peptidase [Candidatus Nomurabacteria bacterium]
MYNESKLGVVMGKWGRFGIVGVIILAGVLVGVFVFGRKADDGGLFGGNGVLFGNNSDEKREIVATETPESETLRVILQLQDAKVNDREGIRSAVAKLQEEMQFVGGYKKIVQVYESLPMVVVEADEVGFANMRQSQVVKKAVEDTTFDVADVDYYSPLATIGGDYESGFSDGAENYDGSGYAVAIIDTGVDKTHPALGGKVVAEACFSVGGIGSGAYDYLSTCPGGVEAVAGAGTGVNCTPIVDYADCRHGTMTAGVATMGKYYAGNDRGVDVNLRGVASGADVIAIQVFSKKINKSDSKPAGIGGFNSSMLAALDYINTTTFPKPVAAVNMSVSAPLTGTDGYCTGEDNYDLFYDAFGALTANGIAVVVANGNQGAYSSYYDTLGWPACVQGAIAVGATNNGGTAMANYSQNAAITTLLASGGNYVGGTTATDYAEFMYVPIPGGGFVGSQGTSFAAPVVAGAYAVLREKFENATVADLTEKLTTTATMVTDNRVGYGGIGAKPLIQLDLALAESDAFVDNLPDGMAETTYNFAKFNEVGLLIDGEADIEASYGSMATGSIEIAVFSPTDAGWQLSLQMVSGSDANNLVSGGDAIPAVTSETGLGGTALSGDAWGFRYNSASNWGAVPVSGSPILLEENGVATGGFLGEWLRSPFEVGVAVSSVPVGIYTGMMVFTLITPL